MTEPNQQTQNTTTSNPLQQQSFPSTTAANPPSAPAANPSTTPSVPGQIVYVVLSGQNNLDWSNDHNMTYLMGVYSTREKAFAEAARLVREIPPYEDGEPVEDLEAWIKEHQEDEVVGNYADWRGHGYQYETENGQVEVTWVEEKVLQ